MSYSWDRCDRSVAALGGAGFVFDAAAAPSVRATSFATLVWETPSDGVGGVFAVGAPRIDILASADEPLLLLCGFDPGGVLAVAAGGPEFFAAGNNARSFSQAEQRPEPMGL